MMTGTEVRFDINESVNPDIEGTLIRYEPSKEYV